MAAESAKEFEALEAQATTLLDSFRNAGYEAYSMAGGLERWAQEQRPLSPPGGRVADH